MQSHDKNHRITRNLTQKCCYPAGAITVSAIF